MCLPIATPCQLVAWLLAVPACYPPSTGEGPRAIPLCGMLDTAPTSPCSLLRPSIEHYRRRCPVAGTLTPYPRSFGALCSLMLRPACLGQKMPALLADVHGLHRLRF